jgi:hypothetical protein
MIMLLVGSCITVAYAEQAPAQEKCAFGQADDLVFNEEALKEIATIEKNTSTMKELWLAVRCACEFAKIKAVKATDATCTHVKAHKKAYIISSVALTTAIILLWWWRHSGGAAGAPGCVGAPLSDVPQSTTQAFHGQR